MTMPHRAAVLALAMLGLAAYANAACAEPGTLTVSLITAPTGFESDPISKCLTSMTITIADGGGTNCQATITPTAADGNFVNAIWGSNVAGNGYTVLQACPTTARAAVVGGATALSAIQAAVNKAIYGVQIAGAEIDGTPLFSAGAITLSRSTNDWVWAVTSSSVTVLTAVTPTVPVATNCAAGQFGIQIGTDGLKICALCPAGTTSTGEGDGCDPCPAGHSKAVVGDATCGDCSRGTYAEAGASDCLPCPAGTFAGATGSGVCSACPDGTYSFIPGSTACLFCVAGVPKCQQGNDFTIGGSACADPDATSTASAGYAVLTGTFTALMADFTAGYSTYAKPPVFGRCNGTNLQLAVTVNYDCSVDIAPATEDGCAEPGASGYSYNNLVISGYYDGTNAIRTLLPTNPSGVSSSFLMSITPKGSANAVTMTYWAATTDTTKAGVAIANQATKTADLTDKGIALVTATPLATCPAGTFTSSGCQACPVGYSCATGTDTSATMCTEGFKNEYIGGTACTTCNAAVSGYTSTPGADYCTVPYFATTACGAGKEYDDALRTCVNCAKGTAGTNTCTACLAGTVAATEGLSGCTACSSNTVAPVDGLSACQTCPAGSVTINSDFTQCVACGPGEYQVGNTCTACPDGYYRSGDATPENNVCKPIPAGYRERKTAAAGGDLTTVDAAAAKSEIVPCEKGTVSYWDADPTVFNSGSPVARHPARTSSTTCEACATRFYAPRVGMQKCLACKAGYVPSQSAVSNAIQGPDGCTALATNEYRDFYSDAKSTCGAGSETGPSNHAACTKCRPGYVNTGSAEYCSPCVQNKAQPLPGQSICNNCQKGEETFDEGNAVCSKCAKGYYNPSTFASCIAAPAGGYVNITGASTYSPCPVGSFSAERGTDWCDICPPGQYANTIGSKACKTCPAGTASSGGASTCKACIAGYYSASGSSVCSPCKAGTYTSGTKSTTCLACPAGHQCPLIGTSAPVDCKIGYYAGKEGSKLCSPCPVNTISTTSGATECTACGQGTSTRGLTGQSKCQTMRPKLLRRSMF